MTYTLDDFDEDGHVDGCDSARLASQTDEVPFCGCAGLVMEVATALRDALPFEPPHLRALVESLTYKPGWMAYLNVFREGGQARGWAFYVVSDTEDSMKPGERIRVQHEFLVPPASWNRDTWAAWIVDRLGDVEHHERNEFVRFDGYREFAPHHGNGEDPYRTWHVGDHEAARKRAGDD